MPKLVFFADAMQHVCRLARVLAQPRGHAILLGVGGSGKRTVARLAAAIAASEFVTLATSGASTHREFREELKAVYDAAGAEGRRVCVYVTEAQLASPSCMEDVSCMLNGAEVPKLLSGEECSAAFKKMQDHFQENDVPAVHSAMHAAFTRRALGNIHIVLAFSPTSAGFRAKCKDFPALLNCCTMDWFAPWPASALTAVAQRALSHSAAEVQAVSGKVADVAAAMHLAANTHTERYRAETTRRVYVTPQSFLHLAEHFVQLEAAQRAQLAGDLQRVVTGLAKLRDSTAAVTGMEADLQVRTVSWKQHGSELCTCLVATAHRCATRCAARCSNTSRAAVL